jgi:hypothetical protein
MEKSDQIVTLETYYDPILAEIIKGKLEANGISCYLADDNMSVIMPIYNQAIGGVKLRVFEHDLEKAKLIIAEDDNLETEEEPVDNYDVACPHCGSTNTRYGDAIENKYDLVATIVAFIFFTLPFYARRTWHCFNCGKDFK